MPFLHMPIQLVIISSLRTSRKLGPFTVRQPSTTSKPTTTSLLLQIMHGKAGKTCAVLANRPKTALRSFKTSSFLSFVDTANLCSSTKTSKTLYNQSRVRLSSTTLSTCTCPGTRTITHSPSARRRNRPALRL